MTTTTQKYVPRLKEFYNQVVVKELMKKFKYENVHQVPKVEKVVINMSVNEAKENIKALDIATEELAVITGQRPKICRAKKSISNFKLKKGMPIGLKVTLRGDIMYDFLDKLIYIALPKIRDFHGISPRGFDGRGNYNLGLTEQYVFPEVNIEKSDRARGMNITIVTSAKTNEEAKELLTLLGFPFRKE